MDGRFVLNESSGEIELYSTDGLDPQMLKSLKAIGFVYDANKKCWSANRITHKKNVSLNAYATEEMESGSEYIDENNIMNNKCCYCGTLSSFLKESEESWLNTMKAGFKRSYLLSLGQSQINAWRDCFRVLQNELSQFNDPDHLNIIFEYSLPYESGRRPDVLLVSKKYVFVLEFKMKNIVSRADLDQVDAYARDLAEYHFESRDKTIVPFLVLTRKDDLITVENGSYRDIVCCSGDCLYEAVIDNIGKNHLTTEEYLVEPWINSDYEPLPTIVEAARMMFKDERKLPNLRRVNSTKIPQAMDFLRNFTDEIENNKELAIVFVTGVPGAGKTYLGMQYVYESRKDDSEVNSVYLSGNGPLVQVMVHGLESKVFVKNLHNVINEYVSNKMKKFSNNIVVFDEGQRAWDAKQMSKKNKGNVSEPDVMISIASDYLEWGVLLILVGEGQEINSGENSGIKQWDDALKKSSRKWKVVCPDKLKHIFTDQNVVVENNLDLDECIRSHLANKVSEFVNMLIGDRVDEAKLLVQEIKRSGYTMLLTRDLESAKEYCRDRYAGNYNKRYGMIAPSKGKILPAFGVDNSYVRDFDYGSWYNAQPGSGKSCCDYNAVLTEFGCQGLELDMPIVCWGEDLIYDHGWQRFKPNEAPDSDANTYCVNRYRVLLTRGRDGFVVFVPPVEQLDGVFNLFESLGVDEL